MAKPVSIIILNFNGEAHTVKCLQSLQKITYPSFEVIVVDNGSSKDSVESIKSFAIKSQQKIRLIESPENLGFAEGNNLGFRNSRGDYIALLNNDTIVDKDWLTRMVEILDRESGVMIVGSRINNTGGFYKGEQLGCLLSILGDPVAFNFKDKTRSFMAQGCSLLYRRSFGEPFDKIYFAYSEDTYLSWRARLMGNYVKIAPESRLDHVGGVQRKNMLDFLEFHGEKNRTMTLLLFYEGWTIARLLPLLFINSALSIFIAAVRRRFKARAGAYAWLIWNLPVILSRRKAIQRQRRVPDKEMLKLMTYKTPFTFGFLGKLYNAFLYAYCWLFRIHTFEFVGEA